MLLQLQLCADNSPTVSARNDPRPAPVTPDCSTANASITIDGFIAASGASVLLGVHMQGTDNSQGLIWSLDTTGTWWVHTSINAVGTASQAILTGKLSTPVAAGAWHTYRLDINKTGSVQQLNAWLDGASIIANADVSRYATTGHFAIGTRNYGEYSQYDNLQLYSTFTQCGQTPLAAGAPISVVNCESEVGPFAGTKFDFTPADRARPFANGTFSVRSNPALCIAATAANAMQLAACDRTSPSQQWTWTFDGISPDNERSSNIANPATRRCMRANNVDIGAAADTYACGNAGSMNLFYDFDAGEIASESSSICLGVC